MGCGTGNGTGNIEDKEWQDLSHWPRITLNELLPRLQEQAEDEVRVYTVATTRLDKKSNEIYHICSGPNLEGGLATLCTCKHSRGVAIFAKAFMGIPAQQAAKTTRPLMPAAAPAVLLHSLDTQQGVSNIILAMTRRDVGKPAFSLRKKTLRENTCAIASGDYSTPVSQRMRQNHKTDEWKGLWILGLTSRDKNNGFNGEHYLFYMMKVDQAFESHKELYEYLGKENRNALQIKNAVTNCLGDIFEPKSTCTNSLDPTMYKTPHKNHSHGDGDWYDDIVYKKKPAPLLVGDIKITFVWPQPMIKFTLPRGVGNMKLTLGEKLFSLLEACE